jgi:thioredoxin-related protein
MNKRFSLSSIVLISVFILVAGAAGVPAARASGGGIQWMSYAEGRQLGKTENKKVFLVFKADWCHYCKLMERTTFRNSAVVAYINRHFVPIQVNTDKRRDLANKFNVRGLPSTLFISGTGKTIGGRPGYIPANEMLRILKYIDTDSYRTMSYQAFVKKQKAAE